MTLAIAMRLLFAATEPITPLPHNAVVPFRQANDKVMDIGRPTGRFQLGIGGVGPSIEQIGPNRVVEEIGLLGYHANLTGQRFESDITQVMVIDGDPAGCWIIETWQQVGNRRLAPRHWDPPARPTRLDSSQTKRHRAHGFVVRG